MQIRILAGCKRLLTAAAAASLVAGPVLAGATGMSPKSGGSSAATPQTVNRIDSSPVKHPVLYPRSNYVWPFASGPTYGEVDSTRWNDPGVVHTNVGSFDMTRGLPNFPTELRATNQVHKIGVQYFLLQVQPEAFGDGSFNQLKDAIVGAGGALVQEMPVAAFLVRMTPSAYDAAKGFPGVIALEPYHPAFKISPMVGRTPLPDPQKALSDTYSLQLLLFPGETAAVVADRVAKLGANVTRFDAGTIYADVNRSALAQVASIEAIRQIFEDLPIFQQAEETTCTMQTGALNGHLIPYHDAGVDGGGGATGNPQIFMIVDSGIQVDAGDLSNTRTDAASITPIGPTHRKVLFYGTTNPFGGSGDLLGCDAPTSGGFTHGHTVSATALGNATAVPGSYGSGWTATDTNGNPWKLDGIAPKAKLVAYDASVTASSGNCDDPGKGGISPGTLYTSPSGGSLGEGYGRGARTVNFSWGSTGDTYDTNPQQIDQFIFDKGDALVFVAAGNNGQDTNHDGIPDPSSVGTPATTKNGVAVGAGFEQNDQFDPGQPNDRAAFSSVGPGPTLGGRTLPLVMAPGQDAIGGQGLQSEFNCRTSDNDQNNPVECDVVTSLSGTSFASPSAAGAALLVRDYFAQGLYPDGTSSNPGNAGDLVPNISGALVKSILIASADYMHRGTAANPNAAGGNLHALYRFNNEQGYGRVILANALPLQNYSGSVTGLIVADGGIGGGVNSTTLNTNLSQNTSTTYNLNVCDTTQPLSIGLSWMEGPGDALSHNLDLELLSPSGVKYIGNFYTDDTNKDGTLTASEDCTYTGTLPWPPASAAGVIDASPFSLPVSASSGVTCGAGTRNDTQNPTEGIHLSPDPARNGIFDNPATSGVDESKDNQIEPGTWTVTVKSGTFTGTQNYALAIAGGVCIGSSVRIEKVLPNNQTGGGTFACNDKAVVTVNEINTATDPSSGLTPSEISSRTRVDVIDPGPDGVFGTGDDAIVDTETGLTFTQNAGTLTFVSNQILLTDGTAPDPGNGVLDVRSGQRIQVTYQDKSSGVPDPNQKRVNQGTVNCTPAFSAGGIVFGQFGRDTFTQVSGGCERDARGYFTFGFPDRYIDHGETVGYKVAFQSAEPSQTLQNVIVSLAALAPDGDSPVTCKPGSQDCADPNRQNNPPSPYITVLDSPKNIGSLSPGAIGTAIFTVRANATISGAQQADMLIGISAKTAGKGVQSYAVQREKLNVDPVTFFYSTDFPLGGGPLNYDANNNELLETVTNDPRNFPTDYIFETQTYSDMTVGGFNTTAGLQAPWNFDTNNGGFTSGLNNTSTPTLVVDTMANWGEDKNFNNKLDGKCTLSPNPVCTQGLSSQNCIFCDGDTTRVCTTNADCTGLTPATCHTGGYGTCSFTAGEDRDPVNTALDQNWSTNGGCGWQTKSGTTGGIWHTGTIRATTIASCLAAGATSARCQTYEIQKPVLPNLPGTHVWWEMLLTPVLSKVNQCPAINGTNCPRADAPGDNVYSVAIADWAWNMEINLADHNTFLVEEFDTDLDKSQGADLFNDGIVTVGYGGTYIGAINGGNAPLIGGFSMFAPVISCVDTDGKGTCSVTTTTSCFSTNDCPPAEVCQKYNDHCGTVAGAACTFDWQCTNFGNDTTGTVGNNRVGANNCAFDGTAETDSTHSGNDSALALKPWGLATPPDDDAQNGYCNRSDALNGFDKSVSCTSNNQCTQAGTPYTTCNNPAHTADQFVQANGPGRNYSIRNINGPDMRFTTLEDIYGDTGIHFRGAIGILNFDPTPSTASGNSGSYGFGIDDMFVSWQESRLDEDTANHCATGQCADVEVATGFAYGSTSVVNVTVTDASPYDPTNNVNDCNDNGVYTDVGDTQDCDGDGRRDVTVHVFSTSEYPGELLICNETSPGSGVFKGSIPYSDQYDAKGVVFVQRAGAQLPTVTAQYNDRDDGTGTAGNNHPCKNNLDPSKNAQVFSDTVQISVNAGRLVIKGYRLVLVGTPGVNGDDDGFADTNETNDMYVTFANKTGAEVDGLIATLGTSDTKIDCISRPIVTVGTLLAGQAVETPTPFRFKVSATADRTSAGKGVNDPYQVLFNIALHSNTFDVTTRLLTITVDLDLNASGGGSTQQFTESFESNTDFGLFTQDTLDKGKNSLNLSNGWRCQYNNPDFINSFSIGDADCFVGFPTDPASGVNDWHVHRSTTTGSSGQRAYVGASSLHYGTHVGSTPLRDSTRLKQVVAVKTINPINLPTSSGSPELSFKQQVSFADSRLFNVTPGECVDKGVVEVQFADASGNPVGNWIKIFPYQNIYDSQGTNDFSNCGFDPTDDGSDEDSFFFPTDPNRLYGPSSTCYPEFVFANVGDIDWRNVENPASLGRGQDGPGLTGSVNRGTWIQPFFNLASFAGRRLRLRFLATSLEVGETQTYDDLIQTNNVTQEDGWYIDDVQIPTALSSPVTLSLDNASNTAVAGVCAACSIATPTMTATPTPPLAGPGQVVTLDASGSTLNACPSGIPQYQFWIDNNANGTLTVADGDTLLRDWTDQTTFIDAPQASTTYGVKVRCSSQQSCGGGPTGFDLAVAVTCPSTGNAKNRFSQSVTFSNKTTLNWTTVALVDVIRGDLGVLRSSASYATSVLACDANDTSTNTVTDATVPAVSQAFYFLVRPGGAAQFCNAPNSWSDGSSKQLSTIDSQLTGAANVCP